MDLRQGGVTGPVTVPLRAALAARSRQEILDFLERVDTEDTEDVLNVTITLWGGAEDSVDMELLYQLVREVGQERVYVDVPFQYDPPARSERHLSSASLSLVMNTITSALSLLSTAV